MENKNEKSLMKKTKAELIDIILRKDDVERTLRSTNENYATRVSELDTIRKDLMQSQDKCASLMASLERRKNELDEANQKITQVTKNYAALQVDFENVCDDNASIVANNKHYRTCCIILSIAVIAIAVLAVIL